MRRRSKRLTKGFRAYAINTDNASGTKNSCAYRSNTTSARVDRRDNAKLRMWIGPVIKRSMVNESASLFGRAISGLSVAFSSMAIASCHGSARDAQEVESWVAPIDQGPTGPATR